MDKKPNFNNTSSKRLHHATFKYAVTKDFNDLDEKYKARKIKTSEELNKYKRLKKIIDNFPKMDNIFKYQENLVKYQESIIDELKRRDFIHSKKEETESYIDKLEDDSQKLKDKILDASSRLRDPNISESEKENLSNSLEDYKKKLGETYLELSKIYPSQNKPEKNKQDKKVYTKFGKLSNEDLCAELEKSSIQISKCSLYLTKLSKGEGLDGIKLREEKINWEKFVASERQADKMRNLESAQKEPLTLQTQIGNFVSSVIGEPEPQPQPTSEPQPQPASEPQPQPSSKELTEYNDFDKKHPRLAKIKNWFKDKFNKIRNRNNLELEEEQNQEPEESKVNPKQKPETKSSINKSQQFKKSLRQQTIAEYDISKIAELGQKGYEQEVYREYTC